MSVLKIQSILAHKEHVHMNQLKYLSTLLQSKHIIDMIIGYFSHLDEHLHMILLLSNSYPYIFSCLNAHSSGRRRLAKAAAGVRGRAARDSRRRSEPPRLFRRRHVVEFRRRLHASAGRRGQRRSFGAVFYANLSFLWEEFECKKVRAVCSTVR